MINYDKTEIRQSLTIEDIFDLLDEWGGSPEYIESGLLAQTICHNEPSINNSHKLYYYTNSGLFHCYSGCEEPSFDIFELTIKVAHIQWNKNFDLNDAVRYIAAKFGILGVLQEDDNNALEDWKILESYENIQKESSPVQKISLKPYNSHILNRFNYNVRLTPWLSEGITQEVLDLSDIGYYPKDDQIVIPHFDKDGNLVGIRGRAMCQEDCDKYGKYRPIKVNRITYKHPLGMNLYNLNNSKDNIMTMKKVIVFESEKSSLLYRSYFGVENDISVACCGSNLTLFHMQALLELGVQEVIIAFDKKGLQDDLKVYTKKFYKMQEKYGHFVTLSFMYDVNDNLLPPKASPIDCGKDIFLTLFKNRIFL